MTKEIKHTIPSVRICAYRAGHMGLGAHAWWLGCL